MNHFRLELIIDGKKLLIELPYSVQNKIQLESYAPFPKHLKGNPIAMQDSEEFKKDIVNLKPKTLEGSPFDNTIYSLQTTLQTHINEYGRLLPSDLFSYIDESIFLISTISDQFLGEKITREDGEAYFVTIFKIIWDYMLPEDMREDIVKAGQQDPMSGFILMSLLK